MGSFGRVLTALGLTGLLATVAWALGEPQFEITRYSIDGGGHISSTGGDFELSGSIGQPDAGVLRGEEFELYGGFWFPLVDGDCNADGGVNLLDHSDFTGCIAGPGIVATGTSCPCFDRDSDRDVDLRDFAANQSTYMGS